MVLESYLRSLAGTVMSHIYMHCLVPVYCLFTAGLFKTRKQTALNRGQTDCISLTHNIDLDLQCFVSHGHEPTITIKVKG